MGPYLVITEKVNRHIGYRCISSGLYLDLKCRFAKLSQPVDLTAMCLNSGTVSERSRFQLTIAPGYAAQNVSMVACDGAAAPAFASATGETWKLDSGAMWMHSRRYAQIANK